MNDVTISAPLEIEYRLTRDDWLAFYRLQWKRRRQLHWWNYPIAEGWGCAACVGFVFLILVAAIWRLNNYRDSFPVTEVSILVVAILALVIGTATAVALAGKKAMERRWYRQTEKAICEREQAGSIDTRETFRVIFAADGFSESVVLHQKVEGVEIDRQSTSKAEWSAVTAIEQTQEHLFLCVGRYGWLIVPRTAVVEAVEFDQLVCAIRSFWLAQKPT